MLPDPVFAFFSYPNVGLPESHGLLVARQTIEPCDPYPLLAPFTLPVCLSFPLLSLSTPACPQFGYYEPVRVCHPCHERCTQAEELMAAIR